MVKQKLNKNIFIGFRITPEMASNLNKLMEVMEYDNVSKWIRKMFKVMIKNGKEKGII